MLDTTNEKLLNVNFMRFALSHWYLKEHIHVSKNHKH